jgi:hypothetical protein
MAAVLRRAAVSFFQRATLHATLTVNKWPAVSLHAFSQPSHCTTSAIGAIISCLISLGLPLPCLLWADASDSYAHRTLQGLPGVYVVIEQPGSELQRHGLTQTQVKNQVVHQLHQAGIRIFPQGEWLQTRGRPSLYVRVATQQGFSDSLVIMVQVELWQVVSLARDPEQVTMALTGDRQAQSEVCGRTEHHASNRWCMTNSKFLSRITGR